MSLPECPACAVVRGARVLPGGVLLREGPFVVHAVDGPTPVPGWLVVTSARCTRGVYTLDAAELAVLMPLCARVMRAQQEALGAEHVYLFAIGDVLRHCHVHLVPRYPGTPAHLRGRGAFDARPGEQLALSAVEAACRTVQGALALTPGAGSR
ncbi:MAG: HIT family protein [Deltaproteobacteria bacterium]|nr:HIT family protein [Deltaproteobacteria bacterium]